MSGEYLQTGPQILTARDLWAHLFGDRRDLVAMFSGKRPRPDADLDRQTLKQAYFAFPEQVEQAEQWAQRQVGRETYFGAHLVFDERRVKENASPIMAVWADNDTGAIPEGVPRPTARLQSSPGRTHDFWRLARPISPARAELINKRLALAIGADPSGVDLTQLLRVPGTPNWKYPHTPIVQVLEIDDSLTYAADDLEKVLPKLPDQERKASGPAAEREIDKADDELLQVMLRSKSGEKIRALLDNDTEQLATYPELLTDGRLDANKADLSLSNSLAFYLGTAERADAAFRRSKRMRSKWDEKHRGDGATYGEMTLEKAFAGRTEFYTPPADGPDLAEGLAEQQAAVEAAEHIIGGGCCPACTCGCKRLKAVESALGNDALTPATRIVTIGAILELDRRTGWKRASKIEQATETPEGFRIVSRDRLSKGVGLSPAAVGRHIKVAVKAGLLRQKVVGLPAGHPDVVTGAIINEPRRYTALALVGSADDALTAMRTVTVERPAWGGPGRKDGTCRKHPLAGTYEKARRTIHCDVCGEILQSEQLVPTGATPPTYACVVTTPVQVVPTDAKAAAARHRAYKEADDRADRASAQELSEALTRLYVRATPVPDETPPDPPANGHAPPPPSPANGSANGHHPPPPPVEPLRATPLEVITLLQAKFGPETAHNQEGSTPAYEQ